MQTVFSVRFACACILLAMSALSRAEPAPLPGDVPGTAVVAAPAAIPKTLENKPEAKAAPAKAGRHQAGSRKASPKAVAAKARNGSVKAGKPASRVGKPPAKATGKVGGKKARRR